MCRWSAKEREIWRSREEKKKDEINNIPQQPGSQGLADYCMKRELIAQSLAGELGELQMEASTLWIMANSPRIMAYYWFPDEPAGPGVLGE